ncbi:MAG: hypothetical protein CFH21_00862 [Alphaproteobacteria bacterium MarineAlpha5_Bin11]|nr:hypothetical protein [Pelagibacteraceae bacterium]PPR43245.1 MAG: hypothetical protein CFH21_00862 [Alphaproteobacteria bacterium MarineAlpha5_Bin11]PPR52172.1 MAG: hypothetical protein CFH20_00077 [Alphaproteobacteria bacterium MarineAlpha5_Bin10]|tara:strand:- start:24 stop:221 length:198 start_codon:yes stop_codon:yes gene_type:complete
MKDSDKFSLTEIVIIILITSILIVVSIRLFQKYSYELKFENCRKEYENIKDQKTKKIKFENCLKV